VPGRGSLSVGRSGGWDREELNRRGDGCLEVWVCIAWLIWEWVGWVGKGLDGLDLDGRCGLCGSW
jgi:hypothetical protein